ncbi:MAG: cytochrome b [Pirellulaceae bacterium]
MSQVYELLRQRLGLGIFEYLAEKKRVPVHGCTHFYFLGGVALFLFAVQIVTGILLSLFYKPSPDQAFESVRAIMTEVDFGWLMRSAHSWSANLLVGILFLHLLTTYMMRAYRKPRELTWCSGVLLLGMFLAFGFSGYLLPWNQLAFFATRVGTAIVGVVPFIGDELLLLARGGEDVTGDTLARFYALHVVVIPMSAFAILGMHLFLVQEHGMSVPSCATKRLGSAEDCPSMPFVPHFLARDMVGWYLALGLLAALAAIFPWELGEKAEPFGSAPEGIRPEWFFLFMFQLLKILPAHIGPLEGEVVGVLFFGVCGLVVVFVPFLDRGQRSRQILNGLVVLSVVFFNIMTSWGWFSAPDQFALRVSLCGFLTLLVSVLGVPFVDPASRLRPALYALMGSSLVVCLVALGWDKFR